MAELFSSFSGEQEFDKVCETSRTLWNCSSNLMCNFENLIVLVPSMLV